MLEMSSQLLVFVAIALLSTLSHQIVKATNLNVYDPVPGLDPSPYYDIRVREKGKDHWIKTFPMITECTDAKNCGFPNKKAAQNNNIETYHEYYSY